MKIAICSTMVPFIEGGARNIVDWLEIKLKEAGHQVEVVYLPQIESVDNLMQQIAVFRFIDLSSADRVICLRPSSYFISHPHKIVWFIHHIRLFYDLWDSHYREFADDEKYKKFRQELMSLDTAALQEAKVIFANSKVVGERLKKYNNLNSEVLYPPILAPEHYSFASMNDEIAYVCRVEPHKRQELLIEAMRYTKSPVKLGLYGVASNHETAECLYILIEHYQLTDRIKFENVWIDEERKREIFANCLAAAYLPLDEDSYGYPSLEASHCAKPILTTTDSGGVNELVRNNFNGYVVESTPQALAKAMDNLYYEREKTKLMGQNALRRIDELNISWKHVLNKILA